MSKSTIKRKCLHCKVLFVCDHRNAKRQKYCSAPECRKASKKASQKLWLAKPENRDYFRSPENVQRVREWRKKKPDYSRRTQKETKTGALQDFLTEEPIENTGVTGDSDTSQKKDNRHTSPRPPELQDSLITEQPVFIGLVAHLTGIALQDDIAKTVLRLEKLGNDILFQGGIHAAETSCKSPAGTPGTQPVQLGGPPSGP